MEEVTEQLTPVLNNKAFSIVQRNGVFCVVQINFNDATGTIGSIDTIRECDNRAHANECFRIEVANSGLFSN